MSDIATLITAIMTSLTFCVGTYKILFERRHNRIILHMLLLNLHADFTRQRVALERIFSDDDPAKPLESILTPYAHDLECRYEEINKAKKYEEICWKSFSEKEMAVVGDYVKELSYFFNLITTILTAAEKSSSLCEYKKSLRNSISEEQCTLFGADKMLPFNIFCRQCFDKITEDWKVVDQILK